MARKTEFQRFVEKIRPPKDPVRDCWLWIGCVNNRGYGQVRIGGKTALAHRYSFEISHLGPCIAGLELDHLCRNPSCVNPNHMEQVTHRENTSRGLVGKLKPGRTSRFTGVAWNKNELKWMVQAKADKKRVFLGCFDNEEDAAKAYRDFVEALDAR